ncbi:OmpA family protein [Enterovibrio sp. ZSDZ35]|uniref:OmpA family protein n=1 Tax=Enterovibrio qingdaonensis TaxID=2899818 RepID=A0ABT5QLN0_9GAMM|nr:OmpA family protein [Enterovibrio sp. ZSDZ35]MDD1781887.1 OmpA family protein [Enterovibrio sp. ZSDZ35]
MDISSWSYSGELFKCTLRHAETSNGKYYFRSLPGNHLSFEAHDITEHAIAKASLYLVSPPWESKPSSTLISTTEGNGQEPLTFSDGIGTLIKGLASGGWIQLRLNESQHSPITMTLPSIRIAAPISSFTACTSRLPEMGYDDARTLELRFSHGQLGLTQPQKQTLAAFQSYVALDTSIEKILIDGHTDATGSAVANLRTSRSRAESVAQTLEGFGIERTKLEVRAHGERYPVASNKTEEGRDQNRRVTLRLVMDTERVTTQPENSNKNKTTNETTKVQK